MNLIGEADIKVDPEEFCDVDDAQANNDGNRWIIICSSTILPLYIYIIVAFIIWFTIIFSFLSNMHNFIEPYLCVFFAHTEEMASVYDEIDVKDEPLSPSLECDQVCSVFFIT